MEDLKLKKYALIGEFIQLFETTCFVLKCTTSRLLYSKNIEDPITSILLERYPEDILWIVFEDLVKEIFPINKETQIFHKTFNCHSRKNEFFKFNVKLDDTFFKYLENLRKSFFKFKDLRNRITHTYFEIDWSSKEDSGIIGSKVAQKKKN